MSLLSLVTIGTKVRACQNKGDIKIHQLGIVRDVYLWADEINKPAKIIINWLDDNENVLFFSTHTLKDFLPNGGLIASYGRCDKIQESWIKNFKIWNKDQP